MLKGKIKWFNAGKGYGFISPEGGGEDVLIHVSDIEQDQLAGLDEGVELHYEAEAGPHGMRATRIIL